jgi:RNA polymerase sigma-70 factor (ECF subfamily)
MTVDGVLAEVVAAARAAWPGIDLPNQVVASYLTERIPDGVDAERALAGMHTSDLYLACGCVLGDATAVSAFERHCLSIIDRTLPRQGFGDDVIAEVKQRMRLMLLVADDGPPGIADFEGRGELRRWVSVMAMREALGMARQRRRHAELDSDMLDESPLASDDAELAYLKRVYRHEFRIAFGEALQKLSDKDRLLLKQQFLDRLEVNEIARLHRVHRATLARWLDRARAAVLSNTRASLMRRLEVPPAELDSIVRLINSQLEVTLRLLLRHQKR